MKHLEVKPLARQRKLKKRPNSIAAVGAFSICLIAFLGYVLTSVFPPYSSDNISDTDKYSLRNGYKSFLPVYVEEVKDYSKTLKEMPLEQGQKQLLADAFSKETKSPSSNKTVLAEIVLWDFADADGDIVRVRSAGYEVEIALGKNPTVIAVPVDASRVITILGVRDGEGGITVGIKSAAQRISLPILGVGETLELPVVL